jgi:hypothetical protein
MRLRQFTSKSDAIRTALREAVARCSDTRDYDYRAWLGLGLQAPRNKRRRFCTEDELWS